MSISENIANKVIKISNGNIEFIFYPEKGKYDIISSNGQLKNLFCSINLSGRARLNVKELSIDNSILGKDAQKNLKNLQILVPKSSEIDEKFAEMYEITDINDEIGPGKLLKIRLKFVSPSTNGSINGKLCVKVYTDIVDMLDSITFSIEVSEFLDFSSPPLLHSISPIVGDENSYWMISENYIAEKTKISFFRNGYQSWSVCELLKYGKKANLTPSSIGMINMQNQDLTIKAKYMSEMVTAITETVTHNSLIIGYITNANQFGRILMEPMGNGSNFNLLFVHSQFDNIEVNSLNKPIISEEAMISITPSLQGVKYLENWAKITSLRMNSRVLPSINDNSDSSKSSIITKEKISKVLSGWCSWYYYYTKIDQQEMIKNIKFLKEHKEFPVDIIQLDDGYQTEVGDFTSINEKFPDGLKWLVDQIHEAGTIAGIWIAPFFAQNRSILLKEHEDWFLRDTKGDLVKTTMNWGGTLYALDLTKNEVISHIKSLISTIINEWGFDFIKIDFIFCSEAIKAVYSNPSLTRAQAYRRGVEAIREAMGDALLLGCGAPLGPCIGLVDVMRIGCDTAAKWTGVGPIGNIAHNYLNLDIPALKPALIATVNRSFMHNSLWYNDPDCVVVRKENSKLDLDEIKLQLTIFGLSGGQVFFSDDLTRLSKERLDFMNLIIPPYKKGAIALDLLDNKPPKLYGMFLDGPIGKRILLSLINWDSKKKSESFIISDILMRLGVETLESKEFIIFDFWSKMENKILGKFKRDQKITLKNIPRHGCKYLSIIPIENKSDKFIGNDDEISEPIFISSNLHITQGCKEISEFKYDSSSGNLDIKFEIEGNRTGEIVILVPNKMDIKTDLPENSIIIESSIGKYVCIPINVPETQNLNIKVK